MAARRGTWRQEDRFGNCSPDLCRSPETEHQLGRTGMAARYISVKLLYLGDLYIAALAHLSSVGNGPSPVILY